jgi:hypothetical protein
MNQQAFEKGLHLKEKRYSHGYRLVYVSYYKKHGPVYQVQRRLFGFLWYVPCRKKNGIEANFLGTKPDKVLEFIGSDMKRRGLKTKK